MAKQAPHTRFLTLRSQDCRDGPETEQKILDKIGMANCGSARGRAADQGLATGSCSINEPSSVSPDAGSSQEMTIRDGAATPTFISTPALALVIQPRRFAPRAVPDNKKGSRITPAAVLRTQGFRDVFLSQINPSLDLLKNLVL